jgi:hypothetical protein
MLTGLILAALLYVVLFLVVWSQTHFAARRGRTSRVRAVVTPWGPFTHVDAPDEATAADALLRADLQLAKEGR